MALHHTNQGMRMVTKIVAWIMTVILMVAVAIVIVKAMILIQDAIVMAVIGNNLLTIVETVRFRFIDIFKKDGWVKCLAILLGCQVKVWTSRCASVSRTRNNGSCIHKIIHFDVLLR